MVALGTVSKSRVDLLCIDVKLFLANPFYILLDPFIAFHCNISESKSPCIVGFVCRSPCTSPYIKLVLKFPLCSCAAGEFMTLPK